METEVDQLVTAITDGKNESRLGPGIHYLTQGVLLTDGLLTDYGLDADESGCNSTRLCFWL